MRIRKASKTVFTPLADGTGVILELETLLYYSVNRSGSALWQEIEKSDVVSLDSLVETVCSRFEVTRETAAPSILSFLQRLLDIKLVQLA